MAHTEKMSFKQFRDKFSDETTCRNYLFKVRWPEGYICPKCGCKEFTYLKCRNGIFQCHHCHQQTTLTAGTVMHKALHQPVVLLSKFSIFRLELFIFRTRNRYDFGVTCIVESFVFHD